MALTITITNPRTIARIEQEAADHGVTPEKAIDAAFAGTVVRTAIPPRQPEDIAARKERALAILKEIHATITDEDRAFDYNAWLYDEHGLPH